MKRTLIIHLCSMLLAVSTLTADEPKTSIKAAQQDGTGSSIQPANDLQKKVEDQGSDIGALKQQIANDESRIGALEKESEKFPWEAVAFYVSTGCTVLTIGVTVYGLFWAGGAFVTALIPLLNFEARAKDIAEKEVKKLNHLLTGRLHYTAGLIFSRVTWNAASGYKPGPIDLGAAARKSAELAVESLSQDELAHADRLSNALNNLLFYTALSMGTSATQQEAAEAFKLAAKLKDKNDFNKNPLFANTYCLVLITFQKYLGDGSVQSIANKLSEAREILQASLLSDHATPSNKAETIRLLGLI